jgi:hypothetical protein
LPYYTTIQISPLLPCEEVGSEDEIVIFLNCAVFPDEVPVTAPVNAAPDKFALPLISWCEVKNVVPFVNVI